MNSVSEWVKSEWEIDGVNVIEYVSQAGISFLSESIN